MFLDQSYLLIKHIQLYSIPFNMIIIYWYVQWRVFKMIEIAAYPILTFYVRKFHLKGRNTTYSTL